VVIKDPAGTKWASWGKEEIGKTSTAGDSTTTNTVPLVTSSPTPATESVKPKESTEPSSSTAKPAPASGTPAYPTSSKSGPKNWDKLGDEELGDDDDKSDINGFFKKMYAGATPDQQRAMMKSFLESNGTALSTDWSDVQSRTFETQPPDGVEAKKWDAK
jgi:suppressor of G2 allele of SKP1